MPPSANAAEKILIPGEFRKQKILICLIFFALCCASCSERGGEPTTPDPPGGAGIQIEGNIQGLLTFENSPYTVIGDIRVDSLQELIIEAGVKLLFNNNTRLIVHGQVVAIGAKNSLITFQARETGWEGIHIIHATGTSIFDYCVIENVKLETPTSSGNGAVEVTGCVASFQHMIFRNNSADFGGGIAVMENAIVDIKNSIFQSNRAVVMGGALFALEASTVIINNTFHKNSVQNVGGSLVFLQSLETEIQNNIFFQNTGATGDQRVHFAGPDSGFVILTYNFFDINDANPLFISDTDLHLQLLSPARKAGNPYPQYNNPDGSRNDQGAYGGPGGDW